ncbi:hypothetical protein BO78DRAFT_392470 [Aspergillus sclerotiicarbonarius CBS 121057]|uniref:Uncharacterized protein n=1 Tax=Aspergillus sclerotiicarbonarius (strain CBS 121057 / IBT 28362) TaxID=1448318 RepID=A0A319EQP7_ASPSB|nr:hypothetical protein BO78DRAFT_392470 [Aspergillus sclerotiicarbonarius CBS 121057]
MLLTWWSICVISIEGGLCLIICHGQYLRKSTLVHKVEDIATKEKRWSGLMVTVYGGHLDNDIAIFT